MKLCPTPASKMCKRLRGRFFERALILEEKVMKWKFKDAYKEYNKACQEMNKRKKECNDFLRNECANIIFGDPLLVHLKFFRYFLPHM